jgi:hypothetical protein
MVWIVVGWFAVSGLAALLAGCIVAREEHTPATLEDDRWLSRPDGGAV